MTGYFKRRVILKQQFNIEKGYYCTGHPIPHEKKNYLSAGPETRRKRSVCSRASKCTIERVPYLFFDKVMGI
jgi:hypothetical protein